MNKSQQINMLMSYSKTSKESVQMRKAFKYVSLALTILLLQCTPPGKDVYLFSYFKNNGKDGLHLAYSYDGFKWTALNNDQSLLKPEAGADKLTRDPCIISDANGTFHMVWTVSWGEKGIGYAHSKDLIHWSDQKFIPVMEHEPEAKNCWAPEIFFDESNDQYMLFWATTIPGLHPETDDQDNRGIEGKGYNHRMYHVTTKDFNDFSETKVLYDKGFNVIDATIVKSDSEYVMFLKDESNKPFTTQKNIRIAKSKNAEGPYSEPSEPITGDYWAEGPTVIKINDIWHLYFDKYTLHKYGCLVSRDLVTWTDKSDQLDYPDGMRHGTVFKVPGKILMALKAL